MVGVESEVVGVVKSRRKISKMDMEKNSKDVTLGILISIVKLKMMLLKNYTAVIYYTAVKTAV